MAFKTKLSKTEMNDLWNSIREIIKAHNDEILQNSETLRDAYYMIRRYLANDYLQKKKITKAAYKLYESDKEAERYVFQDIYPPLERLGYERPKAKPIGIMWWHNYKHTVDKISDYKSQIRGYIFCEKEGAANKIKELSKYGWAIVAGQGQSTRMIREDLKNTHKPVLILHDYDPDGEIIKDSIKNKTRRTTHLDLDLGEQVIDIGLDEKQTDFLIKEHDAPIQPLTEKWKGIWKIDNNLGKKGEKKWPKDYRVELSAFTLLKILQEIHYLILLKLR